MISTNMIDIGKINKFKVLKTYPERNWEVGDICSLDEKSVIVLLGQGFVETYNGDEPNKHVAITVDPINLSIKQN